MTVFRGRVRVAALHPAVVVAAAALAATSLASCASDRGAASSVRPATGRSASLTVGQYLGFRWRVVKIIRPGRKTIDARTAGDAWIAFPSAGRAIADDTVNRFHLTYRLRPGGMEVHGSLWSFGWYVPELNQRVASAMTSVLSAPTVGLSSDTGRLNITGRGTKLICVKEGTADALPPPPILTPPGR